ncbi:MAG: hypothetical protein K5876_00845 [Ruminiclostridium sp.]|nr:hypothetical protein [Ruminiclostridium sp.]
MSLKNKTFQVILKVLCGAFLVLALFFGVTAVVYSTGGGTPNVFGTNVYLLKTDAFGFLKNGTAVIAKQVSYSEIQPKNVVIFKLENGKPALAQVLTADLSDGVYSFRVMTENSSEITLTQSQIVAKGMSYSDLWGGLISFAISPFGILLIAIMPSIIIIILEIAKFAAKIMPQPEIDTVKKQYETPSYSPENDRANRRRRGTAEAVRAYRGSNLDSSIGMYDTAISEAVPPVKRSPTQELPPRRPGQTSPLYTTPTAYSSRTQQQPQPQPAHRTGMPLSQKKLDAAIEAAKAEHELDNMNKMRESVVNDIKKTRGAAIAAEKEFELREKSIMNQAQKTTNLARTAVIEDMSKSRTATITQAAARTANTPPARKPAPAPERPTLRPPTSSSRTAEQPAAPRRPALRLTPEEPVKQYIPRQSAGTNTATSIPRLDALLKEDADEPYNIDDILAGLDRNRH